MSEIKEKDETALKHITNLELKKVEGEDFELIFTFSENEFFTNTTLTKKFFIKDEEPVKSEGTEIDWKEGKNLTKKIVSKVIFLNYQYKYFLIWKLIY